MKHSNRVNSGGLHAEKLPAESRNAFVSSLRVYHQSSGVHPANLKQNRSSMSPKKDNAFFKTMTTFSTKYMKEMQALHGYQRKMDERLSQPKHKVANSKR